MTLILFTKQSFAPCRKRQRLNVHRSSYIHFGQLLPLSPKHSNFADTGSEVEN